MSVLDGRWLQEAVNGVLVQSVHDLRLVRVSDGAGDAPDRKLSSLDDPRLVVMTNATTIGLTRSLNRALSTLGSEFVARHDADDVSEPERLAQQLAFLGANPDVG